MQQLPPPAAGRHPAAPPPPGAQAIVLTLPFRDRHTGSPVTRVRLPPEFVVTKPKRARGLAAGWPRAGRRSRPAPRPAVLPYYNDVRYHVSIYQHYMAWANERARPPAGAAAPHGLQATLERAAAEARARLAPRQAQFPPIVRPVTKDEREFVPRPRLQALVAQAGQRAGVANARATEEAEEALRAVAQDFVTEAVAFAVAMARRRQSQDILPGDLRLYLERTWGIALPADAATGLARPWPVHSKAREERMAAVRRAMAAAASDMATAPV